MSYASAKGKAAIPVTLPKRTAPVRELSDEEMEAVAARVRLVKQHMPEAFEFMKALHAEGLVDGMRCLSSVTVFEEVNHGAG